MAILLSLEMESQNPRSKKEGFRWANLCEGESNSLQVLSFTQKRSIHFALCTWMSSNTEKKNPCDRKDWGIVSPSLKLSHIL